MRAPVVFLIFLILLSSSGFQSLAQVVDVSFEINKKTLNIGEELIFKLIIRGAPKTDVSPFPKLNGFKRKNKSVSHSYINVKGKKVIQHIVTQVYIAELPGDYKLDDVVLKANGELIDFSKTIIKVIGEEPIIEDASPQIPLDKAIQLVLNVGKKSAFVGEGIAVELSFYTSKQNSQGFEFTDNFSSELEKIGNLLQPPNTFWNKREIQEIVSEEVIFQNKEYIKSVFYKSVIFPLKSGVITLPSCPISVVNNGVVSQFKSESFRIEVADLPLSVLKDKVPVGNFSIVKSNFQKELNTGKIYNYTLTIKGDGNFKTMGFNVPENDLKFDFYPPESSEKTPDGSLSGEKKFQFKIFPKDTGFVDLGVYFPFIYFNIASQSYDTLSFYQPIHLIGEKIISSEEGSLGLYHGIENLRIDEKEINFRLILKNIANIILFLIGGATLFLFNWRSKQNKD